MDGRNRSVRATGVVDFILTCLGLGVLALDALGRFISAEFARVTRRAGGGVLTRGAPVVRAAMVAGAALLTLSACALALPAAPRSVRQLPLIHRVAVTVDRMPLPWKPHLPDHIPLPVPIAIVPAADTAAPASPNASVAAPTSVPNVVPRANEIVVGLPIEPLPALPGAVKLDGIRHQWQTWNNCGPATITMAVSYFGRKETQTDAMRFLKTNTEDKNVSPDELVGYVRSLGLDATSRVGGDLTRLKHLLANNIPVVVEVWIAPEPNDWMGHYRLLTGYDDKAGRFVAYDSVQQPGPNLSQPYAKFDEDWRVFNRTYIPVYTKEQAPLVDRILGGDRDDKTMHERALAAAKREVLMLPDDGFAWFNVGSSLTALGKTAEAAAAFDRARELKLPWRMLWYQFSPFEAYLAENRHQDVLALTAANLQRTQDLEESHYFRARALQAQGQIAQARAAYQAALKANGRYVPATHALAQLG